MQKSGISLLVVRRLPRYYRFLSELKKSGVDRVSSRMLAKRMALTASQIRQDFNCFGGFGQQGYGYNVDFLVEEIGKILGLSNQSNAILLGVGNLGRAVASYMDYEEKGFVLTAAFDKNSKVIGTDLGPVKVRNVSELESFCAGHKVDMAVLCVPREAAKRLTSKLIALGVKAFWNFSHYDIALFHPEAVVENVHLNDSLMTLSYCLTHKDDDKHGQD